MLQILRICREHHLLKSHQQSCARWAWSWRFRECFQSQSLVLSVFYFETWYLQESWTATESDEWHFVTLWKFLVIESNKVPVFHRPCKPVKLWLSCNSRFELPTSSINVKRVSSVSRYFQILEVNAFFLLIFDNMLSWFFFSLTSFGLKSSPPTLKLGWSIRIISWPGSRL